MRQSVSCLWISWIVLTIGFHAIAEDQARTTDKVLADLTRYKLLTPERIAALPPEERDAWNEYLGRSRDHLKRELETLAEECRSAGMSKSKPAPESSQVFKFDNDSPAEWFRSEESRTLAQVVISYQTPTGGWSKAVDYRKGRRQPGTHWTSQNGDGWHYCGTLDNRSTTEQIKFLAACSRQTGEVGVRDAAVRGLEWLLISQYPNGGWPQNYPVESGYHEAVTLNDGAMEHAMEVLLAAANGDEPLSIVDSATREKCRAAYERAISFLARAQVRVDGELTVWGAQHDPLTLAPVGARKKEPASLSGAESASMLHFLMRNAPTSSSTNAMIEPALKWLDRHRVTGIRKTKNAAGRTDYILDPDSKEVYWARFYDVNTGQPLFAGADDGIVYSTFSEMAAHNKVAYDYYTTKPGDLLNKELSRWKKRLEVPKAVR